VVWMSIHTVCSRLERRGSSKALLRAKGETVVIVVARKSAVVGAVLIRGYPGNNSKINYANCRKSSPIFTIYLGTASNYATPCNYTVRYT